VRTRHDIDASHRGSADGGTPVSLRAPAAPALAAALACAWLFATAAAAPAPRSVSGASAAPQRAPLRVAGIGWDADAGGLAGGLARAGYRLVHEPGGPAWRGVAWGEPVTLHAEFDASGRLLALELACAVSDRPAGVRYAALVERLRAAYGPWEAQVAPGRRVREERVGHGAVRRTYGERTAATLWTGDDGAAAAVRLAGDDRITVRFESPQWNVRHEVSSPQR